MLSKESKFSNFECSDCGVNNNMHVMDKENAPLMKYEECDSMITQEKTHILDIGFKSIEYVSDELQLKTVEIISDLIDLGVPVKSLDDILLGGVKKYYGIMCEPRKQNYLIKESKGNKGE
jgi:hypothetical protein